MSNAPANTTWQTQDQLFLAGLGAGQRSVANIGVSTSSQVSDAVGPDPSYSDFPMVGDSNNPLSLGGRNYQGNGRCIKQSECSAGR